MSQQSRKCFHYEGEIMNHHYVIPVIVLHQSCLVYGVHIAGEL